MEHQYLTLTPIDRQILRSYQMFVDGMAAYLGNGYEFVLHSLENLDESIIKIVNGYHSGRKEGGPITDLALSMLEQIRESEQPKALTYFNRSKSGVPIKSATIPILGENRRIIALLCINFYTDLPLSELVSQFWPGAGGAETRSETFTENVDELISSALEEARKQVLDNPEISASNKNKEMIRMMYGKGIFQLKDAVAKVAAQMGISKNTVYMHLRNQSEQ